MMDASVSPPAFPGSIPVRDYVQRTRDAVGPHGLVPGNTLAMVGVCRDELTDHLTEPVRATWGPAFALGGLAGMLFLGAAGLRAGVHHGPEQGGRARLVVYVMPHIGVDDDGTAGYVNRRGLHAATPACGALAGLRSELADGPPAGDLDPSEAEMSLLRRRLAGAVPPGSVPDIVELTTIARDAILEDLLAIAARLPEWRQADVAVFSGIHVHTSAGDHVQPGPSSVRPAGQAEQSLDL